MSLNWESYVRVSQYNVPPQYKLMRKLMFLKIFGWWIQYGFPPTFFEVKGIFSDSNSIFLWYESKDINKKAYFQNFS